MKKTLAALAVLGAFAGSAMAADVTLYGLIDEGLFYQRTDSDLPGDDADNCFELKSGQVSGSRWGLKGVEELGNGMKVGFVLENGFNADDGTAAQSNRMFGRESQVYIAGAFGELSFGRVGNLTSGNGTYGIAGNLTPFGTSWGDYAVNANNFVAGFDRYDNTVTYKSPSFAGFNVYAQYSFDTDTKDQGDNHGDEGKTTVNRYAALGATYKAGPLDLVAIVDTTNYSTTVYGKDVDDSITVTFGGSYDFEVVKAYFGAQYFKDTNLSAIDQYDFDGIDGITSAGEGFGVTIGASAPVFGGTAMLAAGYMQADVDNWNAAWGNFDVASANIEISRWGIGAGYDYFLSKRTDVYTVLSYMEQECKSDNTETLKPNALEFGIGLRHRF